MAVLNIEPGSSGKPHSPNRHEIPYAMNARGDVAYILDSNRSSPVSLPQGLGMKLNVLYEGFTDDSEKIPLTAEINSTWIPPYAVKVPHITGRTEYPLKKESPITPKPDDTFRKQIGEIANNKKAK